MEGSRPDDAGSGPTATSLLGGTFDPEEFRRRNPYAVAIDLLYLFTTAFFATLLVRGFWPAVIATVPLVALLYFAWRSTTAFFLGQLVVIALTVAATRADVVPL